MKLLVSAVALASVVARVNADEHVELVKDIYPGVTSSNPIGLKPFDGKAFFAATGEGTGTEPYLSDGEEAGTMMLMDINPGEASSNPSSFTEFNGRLYFSADDGTNGMELWVTDGTMSGTNLFVDINEGPFSSSPSDFVVLGDVMVFQATDSNAGRELWVTDGTITGTRLLQDIQPGSQGSSLKLRSEYVINNDTLIFTADDGVNGESLYATDGTSGGTVFLKDISLSGATESAVVGRPLDSNVSEIYFSLGSDLWITDGTTAGTTIVQEGVAIGGPSRISSYTLDGRTLFYGRKIEESVDNLWETDGTTDGTKVLFTALESFDVMRGASSTFGLGFGPVIGDQISLITDNGSGVNIWVTDGTLIEPLIEATIDWVLDVKPSRNGDQVLFLVKNGTNLELWTSDYTPENTVLANSFPGGVSASVGESLTLDASTALFTVNTPEFGVELWKVTLPEIDTTPTSPTRTPNRSPTRAPTSPTAPSSPNSPPAPTPQVFRSSASMASLGVMAAFICAAAFVLV